MDWKLGKINGDPMVDVAYFCMMFLRPGDYGHQYKPINDHPLLIGMHIYHTKHLNILSA